MPFKITDAAATQIKLAAAHSEIQHPKLRIAARKMVDGGVDYALGFDEPQTIDSSYDKKGVTILIAPTSADYLEHCTLDYVEIEAEEFRFIFLNPNDPNFVAPQINSDKSTH